MCLESSSIPKAKSLKKFKPQNFQWSTFACCYLSKYKNNILKVLLLTFFCKIFACCHSLTSNLSVFFTQLVGHLREALLWELLKSLLLAWNTYVSCWLTLCECVVSWYPQLIIALSITTSEAEEPYCSFFLKEIKFFDDSNLNIFISKVLVYHLCIRCQAQAFFVVIVICKAYQSTLDMVY